jgi:hypothetical protein
MTITKRNWPAGAFETGRGHADRFSVCLLSLADSAVVASLLPFEMRLSPASESLAQDLRTNLKSKTGTTRYPPPLLYEARLTIREQGFSLNRILECKRSVNNYRRRSSRGLRDCPPNI